MGVVKDDVRSPLRLGLCRVQRLAWEISSAVPPLDFDIGSNDAHITNHGSAESPVRRDVEVHHQVPVISNLGTENEDAVDDEYGSLGYFGRVL